jgi:hypothetical protein
VEPLTPLLTASGIVGMFSALAVLIVQMFRQNTALGRERDGQIADLKTDIKNLKAENLAAQAENFACRTQVNSLVSMLQQSGIPLPNWLLRDGEFHER